MAGTTFQVSVVTPERAVLEADAHFVAYPAHDGEVGILPGRAPLLHKLGMGTLRVDLPGDEKRVFFVDGGFAQMIDDKLTLLTEQAREPQELEREAIERLLVEAREARADGEGDGGSVDAAAERQVAVQRARAQLRLLERHGDA
ncbi:MAG: ATP synthase F1 subunit epsilon [Acidobacteriota bacterium]